MHLTPREREKLMIVVAAEVARRRRKRGLKLNHPEAIALITDELLEGARDGRTVEDLMAYGATILTEADVMEGIAGLIDSLQVEATFPDGTKLISVHRPIRPAPDQPDTDAPHFGQPVRSPGEMLIVNDEPIIINEGRATRTIKVTNIGDRPVQVGSHYHFAEVNASLQFQRELAIGCHLDIPAGTSARFEPGDEKEVQLVEYGGNRVVFGFHNEWDGPITAVTPPTPDGIPVAHTEHSDEQAVEMGEGI